MHDNHPDTHHDLYSKTIFGFWCYLLTDFMMFATFFAVYAVLKDNTFGGPSAKEVATLPMGLYLTLLSLATSLTSGFASVFAHRQHKKGVLFWFLVTFLIGATFMALEFREWIHLINGGNSWQKSAFLSAFFTLVSMHGLHVVFALLWTLVFCLPLLTQTINSTHIRRLTCLRMFWQFVNVVWVFIFTIVYLIGGV